MRLDWYLNWLNIKKTYLLLLSFSIKFKFKYKNIWIRISKVLPYYILFQSLNNYIFVEL